MSLTGVQDFIVNRLRGAKATLLFLIVGISGIAGLASAILYALAMLALHDLVPSVETVDFSTHTMTSANTRLSVKPGRDGAARIYDGDHLITIVRGHASEIVQASFLANGRQLVSTSRDGQTRLTNLHAANWRHGFETDGLRAKLYRRLWQPYGSPLAKRALALVAQVLPLHIPLRVQGGNGNSFKDCAQCPQMVEILPGSFLMGSLRFDKAADANERPRQLETIEQAFAVGKYEVTRGEFESFVKDAKYKVGESCFTNTKIIGGEAKSPEFSEILDKLEALSGENLSRTDAWEETSGASYVKTGFPQTDRHPAVCINWQDAQAYVQWLSKKTDKSYRLLTSIEWEYVARSGTVGPYFWGASVSPQNANYALNNKGTKIVGSYGANRFGLHDLDGNVWEWVEDCYNADNSARSDNVGTENPNCKMRERRGGSWFSRSARLRSAHRFKIRAVVRDSDAGFRVARSLAVR